MKEKIEEYLKKEILGDPPICNEEIRALENILTKILKKSNRQTREELRDFLKRWEIRALFVDALQEEKDKMKKSRNQT